MFLLLLVAPIFIAFAQLPKEYELLLKYKHSGDPSIARKILKEYPNAVFKDDLMLLLSKYENSRGKKENAIALLESINPNNLREVQREEFLKLWKELDLDPKKGFLKSPVLFREFVGKINLSVEESLKASEELFKRRYYKEVIALLEPHDFQSVCYMLGMSYQALREREKAIEVYEGCKEQNAKVELVSLYFDSNNRDKIESILSQIEDREVRSEALFRLGRRSLYAGRYKDAIDYFQRMDASYRRDFNLGITYYASGEHEKALDYFLKSVNHAKSGEERSASYFWAYKSGMHTNKDKAGEYLIKSSNGAGFYHAVASSMIGLPIASKAMKAVIEDETMPRTARIIKAIWSAGFPEYARLEAYRRIDEMSSSDILSLSKLDPYLAVRLAVRKYGYGSYVYNAVAFPRPYREYVNKASEKYKLDPALVYAVMRQESLFDPYAVSPANARGLMQLIDSTAQYMARKEGIKIKSIYEPETNINLGASYLRYLLDQWQGDLVRTLASYNAGPTRVKNWQRHQDEYLFIETIPIQETRNYVKKVLYNYYVYSELLK